MIANDQELKVTLALADNVAIVTGKRRVLPRGLPLLLPRRFQHESHGRG